MELLLTEAWNKQEEQVGAAKAGVEFEHTKLCVPAPELMAAAATALPARHCPAQPQHLLTLGFRSPLLE